MGFLARRKAKREAARRAQEASYVSQRSNTYANGLDPVSTALLYTSVASPDTRDEDVSDNADDTAVDDTSERSVDSYESDSDRYNNDTNYGSTYEAPKYDFDGPNDTTTYGSSDSGSSYSDSSSSYSSDSGSSYDSGSSSSSSFD